jgi:hypothetical protein
LPLVSHQALNHRLQAAIPPGSKNGRRELREHLFTASPGSKTNPASGPGTSIHTFSGTIGNWPVIASDLEVDLPQRYDLDGTDGDLFDVGCNRSTKGTDTTRRKTAAFAPIQQKGVTPT